ncbi:hypothetical protein XHC_0633 [Xanthomonas hortorum pv. carotae str. M081]|nr:hypothetical protein XHC_0633 [Xanthomonas hortorum pv. carotae str. M081]
MDRHRDIVAAPRGLGRPLSDERLGNAHSDWKRSRSPMNERAQPPLQRAHT